MVDHPEIYRKQAEKYEALVSREDYQRHLLPAIQSIIALDGISVVELGAGTGRLTTLIAPLAGSIHAFDISDHMLDLARNKMKTSGFSNWQIATGDHRKIPEQDHAADLVISGWSVCYAVVQDRIADRVELDKVLHEIERVLKPGGLILLIETMGTGFTSPHPPDHLLMYFEMLREYGFNEKWIRTDYLFEDRTTAERLSSFFFGDEMVANLQVKEGKTILPECTGLWWKKIEGK